MAKEFLMVGKNIPYEVRTEATRQLERLQEQGAQPIDGEYEKTEEILRFIGMINRCLGEEFRELGIDGYTSIEPGRFHIMSRKAYEALPESEGKIGFHSVTGWAAYLDGDVEKLVLYKTMIHEAVHVCSRSAYKIVGHESGYSMNEYRSGYRSMGFPDRRSGWHEHLRGVNEGVVDIFTLDIIFGHAEEFSGFFSEGSGNHLIRLFLCPLVGVDNEENSGISPGRRIGNPKTVQAWSDDRRNDASKRR